MQTEDEVFSGVLAGRRYVPLRFFGVGVYLVWLFTMHYSTEVFTTSSHAITSLILANIANMAGLAFAVVFASRIAPISTKITYIIASGAMAFAGTVMAPASVLCGSLEAIVFVAGNIMVGLGTALLILLWGELYATIPRRDTSILYSGSFIVAAVGYFIVSMIPGVIQFIVIALLPIMSALMLFLSVKKLPEQVKSEQEGANQDWTFPWRPSILLAIYAFVATLSRSMYFDSNAMSMWGMLVIALVVLFCNLFLYDKFDARLLYKVSPPLMVIGILLISFFSGSEGVGSVLINAGFSGFVILTLIVLSNISYSYGVTAIWLFGLTRLFRVLAATIAACGYEALLKVGLANKEILGAACIALVVIGAMMLLSDKDFISTWGINPLSKNRSDVVESYYATLEGRCSIVAHKYGLTQREEEVLLLLAQNRSVADVEEVLFISNGTAKSHIRHVYSKLDVHSRRDVVELVHDL